MTLKELVRADFEEFIRLDPSVPQELRDSLRLTERVPAVIDNIAGELQVAEARGIVLSRAKIKDTVFSLTALFVRCLKVKADEAALSDVARLQRRHELEGDEIAKKFDDDGNADLTEEFGVVIADKKV